MWVWGTATLASLLSLRLVGHVLCTLVLLGHRAMSVPISPLTPTPEHFKLLRFREARLMLTVNYLTFCGAVTLYLDLALTSTSRLVSR